jgi:uncharacterized protein (DUF1778 family)
MQSCPEFRPNAKPASQPSGTGWRRASSTTSASCFSAADLQGYSLTDFVIATVHETAVQTIESMEIIRLNAQESLKMAQAILNPRQLNAKLRAAAKRYLETHRG